MNVFGAKNQEGNDSESGRCFATTGRVFFYCKDDNEWNFHVSGTFYSYAAVKVPLIHHYPNKEWKQRESMLYARNDGMNIS